MTTTNYLAPVTRTDGPVFTRGVGSFVWDVGGRKYLDVNAGQFSAILGHSHPDVADFICRQANKLQNTSTTTFGEEALVAAKMLNEITPGMNGRSTFLSTGAEANECALRFAKHLTNRAGVVSFEAAWHGLTLGTECVSVSRRHVKPQIPHTFSVPIPFVRQPSEASAIDIDYYVDAFTRLIRSEGANIAAAIFEPIVSSGGMIIPPKEYFQRVRTLCQQYGILLVMDECQTGFGRTGTWFYYEQLNCVPDILVCGKGMGLGYPVSAVVFNDAIIPHDGFRMQMYSTHQNDPFNCGIVAFAVEWISRNKVLNQLRDNGSYLLDRLLNLSQSHSLVSKPRGCGLMCGFDLFEDGHRDQTETAHRFLSAAIDRGCVLQVANAGRTVRLLPSYLINREEIDQLIGTIESIARDEAIDG